ncbi:type I inositol polyphosphate 5-phosphatase 10 isoform X1 [Tanacetum coccineum]
MKNAYDPTEIQVASGIGVLDCADLLGDSMSNSCDIQSLRVFTATWNVAGISPSSDLNLDNLLQIHRESDIYVLGFQEMVPLNAGNVLVIEDNGSAAKWLSLISQSLNKATNNDQQKFSDRELVRKFKSCIVLLIEPEGRSYGKDSCFACQKSKSNGFEDPSSSEEDDNTNSVAADVSIVTPTSKNQHLRYSLIKSKQMGCISVSMTFKQTSLCFVCSHLASGEKEGDELRRNSDVIEILKSTQFPKICKISNSKCRANLDHDRVIWLGDLNYRIALSYHETKKLLEQNDWDALLNKDQLKLDKGRLGEYLKDGKRGGSTSHQLTNTHTIRICATESFGMVKGSIKSRIHVGIHGFPTTGPFVGHL